MKDPLKGLPTFLREIAETTKAEIAWRLMETFGGTKLYIPKVIDKDHELSKALGFENAQSLIKNFGGIVEDIPNGAALRSKKIAIHEMEGSTKKIARELGVTERWVRMVKNPTLDERQEKLFD